MLELNANAAINPVIELDSGNPSLSGRLRIDGAGGFELKVTVTEGDAVSMQPVNGRDEPFGNRTIIEKGATYSVTARTVLTSLGRSHLQVDRVTERGHDDRVTPDPVDVKSPTITVVTDGEPVTRDAS